MAWLPATVMVAVPWARARVVAPSSCQVDVRGSGWGSVKPQQVAEDRGVGARVEEDLVRAKKRVLVAVDMALSSPVVGGMADDSWVMVCAGYAGVGGVGAHVAAGWSGRRGGAAAGQKRASPSRPWQAEPEALLVGSRLARTQNRSLCL